MDIKSMTAGQIAKMTLEQFNSLTAAEARQALAKVRRSVNQRERRLNALDYSSPALEAMKKSGGKHLKPASNKRNENLAELKRGIDFLNDKTSTVPGARAHFEMVRKDLGLSPNATKETIKQAYEDFRKAQQDQGGVLSRESGAERYSALKARIGKWSEAGNTDEDIRKAINKFYEREQANSEATAAEILAGIEKDGIVTIPTEDNGREQ